AGGRSLADRALQAELDVLGGRLLAGVEIDAFAEMERPALVIGRRLPARREPRVFRQLAVGRHADQVVEHERHVVLHHVTARTGSSTSVEKLESATVRSGLLCAATGAVRMATDSSAARNPIESLMLSSFFCPAVSALQFRLEDAAIVARGGAVGAARPGRPAYDAAHPISS